MHGGFVFKLDMRLTDQKVGKPRMLELPVQMLRIRVAALGSNIHEP